MIWPQSYRGLVNPGERRLSVLALVFYRKALLCGERAEIDLNLGLAYEMLGNRQDASAAILRAGWVGPAIVSALPAEIQPLVNSAIDENTRRLHDHSLCEPPPLPATEKPTEIRVKRQSSERQKPTLI